MAITTYRISGKLGGGKVWRIDSFQVFGKRKFGELIDHPIRVLIVYTNAADALTKCMQSAGDLGTNILYSGKLWRGESLVILANCP